VRTCVALVCLTVLTLAWLARDRVLEIHVTHTIDLRPLVKRVP
jgi:hypothetical protein